MKNKSGKVLLNIVKVPDPILKNPNEDVVDFEFFDRNLIVNMIYTMNSVKGIGIALPQIGINKRMFVALIDKIPIVVFNPKVVKESDRIISFEEGCLSIPGETVKVTRPYEILVEYQDLKGRTHNKIIEGINSIIFLHEYDHVLPEGGRLITDYKSIVA